MRGAGQVHLGLESMRQKWGGRMRVRSIVVALSLGLLFSVHVPGQNSAYDRPVKEIAVHAKILAISTAVHQNFAGSEDVYIADISLPKVGNQMVKLVDTYSASQEPIRTDLLVNHRSFRMKITRDFSCDGAFIGTESRIFDPSALASLKPDERAQMPCYRIDHEATRLGK